MQDRATRLAREERRRAEKRLRNQTEDLRYALKKLTPPVELDTPYDQAVPQFSALLEFQALEGHDDARKEAYARYMDRLKEKAEDKKSRRRDDDGARRSSRAKDNLGGYSDDDGSVTSAPKRRRKDHDAVVEGDDAHSSPRSTRRDEERSSRHHRSSRYDDDRDRDRSRRDRDYDERRKNKDRRSSKYDDDEARSSRYDDDIRRRDDKRSRPQSRERGDDKLRESKVSRRLLFAPLSIAYPVCLCSASRLTPQQLRRRTARRASSMDDADPRSCQYPLLIDPYRAMQTSTAADRLQTPVPVSCRHSLVYQFIATDGVCSQSTTNPRNQHAPSDGPASPSLLLLLLSDAVRIRAELPGASVFPVEDIGTVQAGLVSEVPLERERAAADAPEDPQGEEGHGWPSFAGSLMRGHVDEVRREEGEGIVELELLLDDLVDSPEVLFLEVLLQQLPVERVELPCQVRDGRADQVGEQTTVLGWVVERVVRHALGDPEFERLDVPVELGVFGYVARHTTGHVLLDDCADGRVSSEYYARRDKRDGRGKMVFSSRA